ncbi:MAG: ABC transporter permease [Actinomycetaceae bacterium]|nr:ABC transporter permease [Actinomycetaceae bacterium]
MSRFRPPPLLRYIAIRALISVFLLFGVTVMTFILTNLIPADPVQAALGELAAGDPQIVAQFRANAGLDKPLPVQYGLYLENLLHGDLGVSNQTRLPVAGELSKAFPATVELALVAMTFAVFIGIGMGLWAALRHNRIVDHIIRTVSLVGISIPTFWLGMVVFFVFFYQLGLLPGSGRLDPTVIPPPKITGLYTIDAVMAGQWGVALNALEHLVLPASTLALFTIGLLTRFTRSSVLEVLSADYIRAAKAKGLPPGTIIRDYVMRAALVPVLTMVGLTFGSLLSGTVLVEKIFSWHGLGEYAFMAATKLDLPAVMGVGLIVGFIYIGINFIVDLLYGFIDPRVRVQ